MNRTDDFLRQRYDSMWAGSLASIRSGAIEIDPVLAARMDDQRRGMTLVIRPTAEVRQRVGACMNELRSLEPDQYYYHPDELHVTFLSMFTATEMHAPFFSRADEYAAAVAVGVRCCFPFTIAFTGVTMSAAAVMVQGFTDAAILNAARDGLRQQLGRRGLGTGVDLRYRLETAHLTVVRFRAPLRDAQKFAASLERLRGHEFSAARVESLELVRNDWYMSRNQTDCVQRYRLGLPPTI